MINNLKFIFQVVLLIASTTVFAQIGVGTTNPDASAQLELSSTNKGMLLPAVSLTGIDDTATITNGNVESLILYNQATAGTGTNEVTPGFYYWSGTEWKRIAAKSPSKRIGEFVYAKSGKTVADGFLAVNPGTISGGATTYPLWAAQYPEFISGTDIVFPVNVAGVFLRNTGGDATTEGVIQEDATALPNDPFVTNNNTHSHTFQDNRSSANVRRNVNGTQTSAQENDTSTARTTDDNTHGHTISGGGDIETRPSNRGYQLYTVIDTY